VSFVNFVVSRLGEQQFAPTCGRDFPVPIIAVSLPAGSQGNRSHNYLIT